MDKQTTEAKSSTQNVKSSADPKGLKAAAATKNSAHLDINESDKDKLNGSRSNKYMNSDNRVDDPNRLETGHTCTKGWMELRPRGKLPEKRSHHSSIVHQNFLYVFGGEDSREGKYGNLWRLNLDDFIEIESRADEDLGREDGKDSEEDDPQSPTKDEKLHWRLIETKGKQPGKLSHHQAQTVGDLMYLFGGMREDASCNDDLYSLDMTTFEWKIIKNEGDVKPEGRDDHTMVGSDSNLYVFGGFVKGKRMNDLYSYDILANKWE